MAAPFHKISHKMKRLRLNAQKIKTRNIKYFTRGRSDHADLISGIIYVSKK